MREFKYFKKKVNYDIMSEIMGFLLICPNQVAAIIDLFKYKSPIFLKFCLKKA
jgi:hypothetical protein